MPDSKQILSSLQPVRNISLKVNVLDYDYNIIDEISGLALSASLSIDADSDIRRTINIEMMVSTEYTLTTSIGGNIGLYWRAGNPYWFDKYIQIYVGTENILTGEIDWVNQGIYLINTPTINYDATTRSLSFEGVDLMSKLTGLRNGYIEGITYQYPSGSTITDVIRAILKQQGFTKAIIQTPPVAELPYDINIDIGSTAYDALSQIRDINPNWEMFFDVDGVFYFQQIPSGTPTEVPVVNDKIWEQVVISYDLETNFEDVKNYIDVVGRFLEVDEVAQNLSEYDEDGSVVSTDFNGHLQLSRPLSYYFSSSSDTPITWRFAFVLGDISQNPMPTNVLTGGIDVVDKDGRRVVHFDEHDITGGYYYNQSYVFQLKFNATGLVSKEWKGYQQPRAIAFESNSESPFYVGDITEHQSNGKDVNFVKGNPTYIEEINFTLSQHTIDIRPYISKTVFDAATEGTQWVFRVNTLGKVTTILVKENWTGQNISHGVKLYNDSTLNNQIYLDFKGSYLIALQKQGSWFGGVTTYYNIPASNIPSPSLRIYSLPKFSKQVRGVCSGDEYDNIFSDKQAVERAKYELYLKARRHDTITLTCVPLYWLDVNQLVSYTLPNNDTDKADYWIIKSISTDFDVSGTQTVTMMRYYPLYEF